MPSASAQCPVQVIWTEIEPHYSYHYDDSYAASLLKKGWALGTSLFEGEVDWPGHWALTLGISLKE